MESGLGIGGRRRFGKPKSDAERRASHRKRFGTGKLPKRGSGYIEKALDRG